MARVRATCVAALAALRTEQVEGLSEPACNLLCVLQLAEWLWRGIALRVTDDITTHYGWKIVPHAHFERLLMLLVGIPMHLLHVMESWVVACECSVGSHTYENGTLEGRLLEQVLPRVAPQLGVAGQTDCEAGQSGGEGGSAAGTRTPSGLVRADDASTNIDVAATDALQDSGAGRGEAVKPCAV